MKRVLLAIAFFLPTLGSVEAAECPPVMGKLAKSLDLEPVPRGSNLVLLKAHEEDGYFAFFICRGSLGMTLRFLSDPDPTDDWYQFVARAGEALTGTKAASIGAEVRACAASAEENAGVPNGYAERFSPALRLTCEFDSNDRRIEIYLAK